MNRVVKVSFYIIFILGFISCHNVSKINEENCERKDLLKGNFKKNDFDCFINNLLLYKYMSSDSSIDENDLYNFFLYNSIDQELKNRTLLALEYLGKGKERNLYSLERYFLMFAWDDNEDLGLHKYSAEIISNCPDIDRKKYIITKIKYNRNGIFLEFFDAIIKNDLLSGDKNCYIIDDIYRILITKSLEEQSSIFEMFKNKGYELSDLCQNQHLKMKLYFLQESKNPNFLSYANNMKDGNYFDAIIAKSYLLLHYSSLDSDVKLDSLLNEVEKEDILNSNSEFYFDKWIYGVIIKCKLQILFKSKKYQDIQNLLLDVKPNPYMYFEEEDFFNKFTLFIYEMSKKYNHKEIEEIGLTKFTKTNFYKIVK